MMKNKVVLMIACILIGICLGGYFLSMNVSSKRNNTQANSSAKGTMLLAEKIGEDLYVEELEKGVYVVNHEFPWAANSMVVEMKNGDIVLVDTPYTPEATEELLSWINKCFKGRKLFVLNTGFHFDNLGGNQALVKRDIPVCGSSLTVEMIDKRGEESRKLMMSWLDKPESKRFYDAYQKIPYVAPTKVFDLNQNDKNTHLQSIKFGDEEVEVYYPGATHSDDNMIVYFTKRNILFGGCMIKSMDSKDLGNTADANLHEWPKSVKKVLERYGSSKIVVPGHGRWGNTDLIKHTLQLCEERK